MKIAAVILAGGSGTRMGTNTNKPYLEIGGRPLLWFSVDAFRRAEAASITVVTRPKDRHLVDFEGVTVVDGGPTRTASEHAGLAVLESSDADVTMIHDAARPFLRTETIRVLADEALGTGGAVPALPFEAAPWSRDGSGVLRPAESDLVRVQTPQAFRTGPLLAAYRKAGEASAVAADTAEIVERFSSMVVAVIEGDPDLFKVTYLSDLDRIDAAAAGWGQDGVS